VNQPGPVDRVASLLEQGGYGRLPSPVAIAGVPFDFSAVLVGGERAFDLVVVTDTVLESDRRLRQRVEALARALDVAGSRRSLTVVTVGPPPAPQSLEIMSRVARVLVVRADGESGSTLRDSLAVLMPLELPAASAEASEPFDAVETWMREREERAGLEPLVAAATQGQTNVTAALAEFMAEPLPNLSTEN
jgi:hypothetical protein